MSTSPHPTTTGPGRPTPREDYHLLAVPALLEAYRSGITRFDRRLLELPTEKLDTFFRPEAGVGRWSCRVLAGHLADGEIAFTHRFRRTVAEDGPILPGWDEDAFIDAGLYKDADLAGFIAVIHTLRVFTGQWLATLEEPAWSRRALRPEYGERTLHGLLADAVWHVEHHCWFLDRKLARLIDPAEGG